MKVFLDKSVFGCVFFFAIWMKVYITVFCDCLWLLFADVYVLVL